MQFRGVNGYIFNLGHGVVPHTPPEHIQDLVDFIRIKSGK